MFSFDPERAVEDADSGLLFSLSRAAYSRFDVLDHTTLIVQTKENVPGGSSISSTKVPEIVQEKQKS
jgi:hypothetical protein